MLPAPWTPHVQAMLGADYSKSSRRQRSSSLLAPGTARLQDVHTTWFEPTDSTHAKAPVFNAREAPVPPASSSLFRPWFPGTSPHPPTGWENYRSADSDAEVGEAPSTRIGVEGLQDLLARANSDQVTLTSSHSSLSTAQTKPQSTGGYGASSGPTSKPTSTKGSEPSSLASQTSQLMS